MGVDLTGIGTGDSDSDGAALDDDDDDPDLMGELNELGGDFDADEPTEAADDSNAQSSTGSHQEQTSNTQSTAAESAHSRPSLQHAPSNPALSAVEVRLQQSLVRALLALRA